ncbi:Spy/CpxP family protein refolding chaperone [Sulfuritalea hydrogenivorans]|uniref:Periplasmic heavy metal sensor n=1 Tax=Sulfuritalea hydrogenivorans sk43H TaxID=1223802 RepID=W0SF30_9PROT|nr:Spy/CpxP family protein refolding chaperone [Sulfuritalea hydrogenivorans]BAO28308.1 hypothetical protein SUTH_00494 [Sulfuritalea hydrogenivorans sk43H]
METTQHLRIKRFAAGAVAIALPLAVTAHGPMGDSSESCPPTPHTGDPMALPPPGRFPVAPLPGAMPMPPYLHGLELTEAQRDKLFALMHDQAPNERDQLKRALRAMEDLRRLVTADRFDVDKARILAETHGQALAQLALMHAELDARMRTLLTPEQRQQLDDARTNAESRRGFKRS